jgi:hypothetical protein
MSEHSKLPLLKELPDAVQAAIKTKARWEHMTISAVMLEWPQLWRENAKTEASDE